MPIQLQREHCTSSSVESPAVVAYDARMEATNREWESVRALIERMQAETPREVRLQHRPLRGGLEAAEVQRLTARYRDHRGRP